MKKVATFVDRWMSGGIESYLVSSYEQLDLSDLDITIITTKKLSNLYDERLEEIGIDIIELLPKGNNSEITRTVNSKKKFKEIIFQEKFDIIHLNIYNGFSLVYAKIAWKVGVKHIIAHSHNSAIGNVRLKKLKILAHNVGKKKYEKYVTDFWACSDLAGEWLFSLKYKNKIKLMKNGIDTKKFRFDYSKQLSFREKYNIPKESIILGNVGRLNNQKNQMFLLEIARKLSLKKIPFVILIAGEGELKKDINNKIKKMNLENNIFLIGAIKDTPSFYSGIDVFLLPSLFEGNPIAGIEAQCSGCICLFSDRITKQLKIIDSSYFLSLNNSKKWVDCILENFHKNNNHRSTSYKLLNESQFDILDTAEDLKYKLVNY